MDFFKKNDRDLKKFYRMICSLRKFALLLVIVISLQGCVTMYQKNGLTGGYSDIQLDENVFTVTFQGNGYTSKERVTDFALLRSAELTLHHGFLYFTIIDENSYAYNKTYTTPQQTTTTSSVYGTGNYFSGSSTTYTTGGHSFETSKPGKSNTIVCFRDKPETIFTYNAKFVSDSLRKKYQISQ